DDDDYDDHDNENENEHEHEHHHHHHHHDDEGEAEEYGIGTFVYYQRRPLDLNKFDYMVARKWPKSIIRAKGLCYFAHETDKCYLFEQAGVQKTLRDAGLWFATMPEDQLEEMMKRDKVLRRDWDEKYGDRMNKIVFIGQHLDKNAIVELMDGCLADQDLS
ncbi:MAG: GTP-binding protein, partial [Bacteroidales bacterium]|nr:GTP-binding protein [Bacteroidales bacterium]